jgi:hypothetical protein
MPISDDEWKSGKQWDDIERAVAEFLDAVEPRAYTVAEVHELLVDGGTVTAPPQESWCDEDDDGPERVDVAPMDVTERAVRKAITGLRDAEYLASKRIETDEGVTTYYRRGDGAFFG